MAGMAILLSNIVKKYGATKVLRGINIKIEPGQFLTIVGPSGCGKSTLLRIIAGLEAQDGGNVCLDDQVIDHLRPKQRNVAMVFQSYALYPHMTVSDNLAIPLIMQRMTFMQRFPGFGRYLPGSKRILESIEQEVLAVAQQLRIEGLLRRKPGQLSGGQRQRVALGRAMMRRPNAFLMDEPLSNLDARLRVQMRAELTELHRRLETTFIYVTHDQVEAMTMSQKIAVMFDGDVVQLGSPSEIYDCPRDLRVAQFIGSPPINVLPGVTDSKGCLTLLGRAIPLSVDAPIAQEVQVGIRPEDIQLRKFRVSAVDGGELSARIRHIENLGNEFVAYLDLDQHGGIQVTARIAARDFASSLEAERHIGANVTLVLPSDKLHVFDSRGLRIAASPRAANRSSDLASQS